MTDKELIHLKRNLTLARNELGRYQRDYEEGWSFDFPDYHEFAIHCRDYLTEFESLLELEKMLRLDVTR